MKRKNTVLVFWSPDQEDCSCSRRDLIGDLYAYFPNLTCIDCRNLDDPERMFYGADLIAVWISQNSRNLQSCLERFRAIQNRVIYIIYDYFENAEFNRKRMVCGYRIKEEQICTISYNSRIQWVNDQGLLQHYLKGPACRMPYEEWRNFARSLHETRAKLIRALCRVQTSVKEK